MRRTPMPPGSAARGQISSQMLVSDSASSYANGRFRFYRVAAQSKCPVKIGDHTVQTELRCLQEWLLVQCNHDHASGLKNIPKFVT